MMRIYVIAVITFCVIYTYHYSPQHLYLYRSLNTSYQQIGEKLVNFMVEPKKGTKWPKELPKFKSRPDAIAVCKELCGRQFMHRSEKVGKGELEVRSISILC